MKKLFLLLVLVLFGGAWVGEKMVQDPGYVLVSYNQTTIETSLWVLIVLAAASFLILHWALNLLFNSELPTRKLMHWRERSRQRSAQKQSLKGLLALSEGNWQKAQRQLSAAAERSELPLVNYLAAARAAHEQGNHKTADELLQKARNNTPEAEVAVGIAQAQFQLDRGQLEPCLAVLLQLRRTAPNNSYILKLLKEVYVQLKDWQSLSGLLPELRKQQVFPQQQLADLTEQCHMNRLEGSIENLPVETSDTDRLKTLAQLWDSMPTEMTRNLSLVERYCQLLVDAGADDNAEQTIKALIKRSWDDNLVELYGRINSSNAKKQFEQARSWSKKHSESSSLSLTLGRLAMRNEQWQQALDYFQQSMDKNPNREALAEQIRLMRNLGDNNKAEQALADNLPLLSDKLPALPLPADNKDKAAA